MMVISQTPCGRKKNLWSLFWKDWLQNTVTLERSTASWRTRPSFPSRWAPATPRQRLRLLHHPGPGGGHVRGGAVHRAGLWLGQIMSQSVLGRQRGLKPRTSRVGRPLRSRLLFFLSSWAMQHSETQSSSPVRLLLVPVSPSAWPLSSALTMCKDFPYASSYNISSLHLKHKQHFFSKQSPPPPPRAQHKHGGGRASLTPACSFNRC